MKNILFAACLLLLFAGCSGGDDAGGDASGDAGEQQQENSQQEHVWSEQTNTINKARNVENILGDAAARQRREIDGQSQ